MRARTSALNALNLDENQAEAHIILGRIKELFDWDWTGADQELRRGIELNPTSSYARILYANYLTETGRPEESIAIGRKTLQVDPLSPAAYNELAWALQTAGHYDEALEQYRKGLELDPNFLQSNALLTAFYIERGDIHKAASFAQKLEHARFSPMQRAWQGYFYAALGRRSKALSVLKELRRRARNEYVPPMALANVYLGLGDNERALHLMESAYLERDINLMGLTAIWAYNPLRSDPRFQELLRRMNFPSFTTYGEIPMTSDVPTVAQTVRRA